MNTILGTHEAVFTCVGENVFYFKWFVDGLRETHPVIDNREIKHYNGFIESVLKFSSLTVPASVINKNSSIQCSIRGKDNEEAGPTDAVLLLVQGYTNNTVHSDGVAVCMVACLCVLHVGMIIS